MTVEKLNNVSNKINNFLKDNGSTLSIEQFVFLLGSEINSGVSFLRSNLNINVTNGFCVRNDIPEE